MIFYTSRFVPEGFAGCAIGPFIFIRPQYREDKGLLAYEQKHAEQFHGNFAFHGLQYCLQSGYRLRCEIEAYQTQLKVSLEQWPHKNATQLQSKFAGFISEKYGINISTADAFRLLSHPDIWDADLTGF